MRRCRDLFFHLLVGACLSAPVAAPALDRDLSVRQLHHTSWGAKDGAPLKAWQIEQTTDGWIWLGGPQGLYRFDGIAFEQLNLPGSGPFRRPVWTLKAAPPNDLWIGLTANGGTFRLRDGRLSEFGAAAGLNDNVQAFAVSGDSVWAITRSGLLRFDGTRWNPVHAWSLKDFRSEAQLMADGRGRLWACANGTLGFVEPGGLRFEPTTTSCAKPVEMVLIDGAVWLRREDRFERMPDSGTPSSSSAARPLHPRQAAPLVDRDRVLWTADCAQSLCRIRVPESNNGQFTLPRDMEALASSDGLSGAKVMSFLEDAQGSIWVVTDTGLDRFRRNPLVPMHVPFPDALTLVPGPGAGVTIGAYSTGPPRGWLADRHLTPAPGPERSIYATHRDPRGVRWLAGATQLWREQGASFVGVDYPADVHHSRVKVVTSDQQGGVWLSFLARGVWRFDGQQWQRAPEEVPANEGPGMAVDLQGRMWFGLTNNVMLVNDRGRFRRYTAEDGIDIGTLSFVHAKRHVVGAGTRGAVMKVAERFVRLRADDPAVFEGINGVVEDADGNLWLNGSKGAVRIARGEIARLEQDVRHRLRYRLFDIRDGYPDSAPLPGSQTAAVSSADGRLWFAGISGISWLDPKELPDSTPPPAVVIRDLVVGDTAHLPAGHPSLVAGTTGLEIRFTALHVPVPERVLFRHRLDGVDADWSAPSPRREAIYTNLGPGNHRFQVMASHEDGVWSAAQTMHFSIRPTPWQTWWFKAACAALAMVALWLLVALRVRQVRMRMREKMQERLVERERIARELHDTLLQGVQGLILKFHSLVDQLPRQDPTRQRMAEALQRADLVLAESRERVLDLHGSSTHLTDIVEQLTQSGRELSRDHASDFRITIHGTPRKLNVVEQEEILQILREALLNAFRHACSPEVLLELTFGWRELHARVVDKGTGIPDDVLREGREGHLGIRSMRERARRIGAALVVHSTAGSGTVLDLRLKSTLAYARPMRGARWWNKRQAAKRGAAED